MVGDGAPELVAICHHATGERTAFLKAMEMLEAERSDPGTPASTLPARRPPPRHRDLLPSDTAASTPQTQGCHRARSPPLIRSACPMGEVSGFGGQGRRPHGA